MKRSSNKKNLRGPKGLNARRKAVKGRVRTSNFKAILFNQDVIVASALASRLGIKIPTVSEVAAR